MGGLSRQDILLLQKLCPDGVTQDVDLASISRWRIGGRARLVVEPASVAQLAALRRFFHERRTAHIVIGLTTNLLFDDEGLDVPCLRIGSRMSKMQIDEWEIGAEAGTWVPALALAGMRAGLTGLEHTCGIPATLGGLIFMNGGSQRKGIGTNVVSVESVGPDGAIIHRAGDDCKFAYRYSVYQENDEVISSVRLRLGTASRASIRSTMRAILKDRSRKFPRKQPNCGSVFKSSPAMYDEVGPPGAVIERLGMKGLRCGGAQISPQHANFIVNTGGARSEDVLSLIAQISDRVFDETGFRMEAEARHILPDGSVGELTKN